MLTFSTTFPFLYFESLLKTIAQIDTTTEIRQQPPSDQNQTGLGVETPEIIEGSNISTILKLLSTVIETQYNKSATILEITSKLPEVTNISCANAITEKSMGIPQDLDLQKRNIARYILEQDKEIASIFFLTPKGDIYIGEPYSDQQRLPRLNYADRDWYKGVTRTNDTYVSAVFLSAAIHVPAIAIAVPVYRNITGNDVSVSVNQTALPVVGYWVGILNTAGIKGDLLSLNLLNRNNTVLLIDHNGTQVFDILARTTTVVSSPAISDNQNQSLKSFSHLRSVKNALEGKSGSVLETIDDVKTTIYYYPVEMHPHKWALLLLQPSE